MKEKADKPKFKESKIGKIIYGFLMFAPLLAIGVTCGYAMLNKNAYKSYSDKVDTTIETVKNNDIVNAGTLLTFTYNGNALYDNPFQYYVLNNETDILKFLPNENFIVDRFNLLSSGGRTRLQIFDINNNQYNVFNWQDTYSTFYCITKNQLTFTTINSANFNVTYVTYIDATIDNVFYYSIDKVEQSNLFNWAKSSNIYTGMHNFTTAMNVSNTFIPMILTYWLIISVIYFLYDIVLLLVSILHRKIHNLQDSI